MIKTECGEIVIGPISDPRLTSGMNRIRSGSRQLFGHRLVNGGKLIQECDFSIEPPERHFYAVEIDGVWMWVNGCGHCNQNGEKSSYVVCDEHDRCQRCDTQRDNAVAIPPRNKFDGLRAMYGTRSDDGMWGWTCYPCYEKQEAKRRSDALSRIIPDDEYNPMDFWSDDKAKCPYCSASICTDESYDADSEKLKCDDCGHIFTLTANHHVTWTTARVPVNAAKEGD